MFHFTCDHCGKKIERESTVHIDAGWGKRADLCLVCGKPVILLMKRYKLIPRDIEKQEAERRKRQEAAEKALKITL